MLEIKGGNAPANERGVGSHVPIATLRTGDPSTDAPRRERETREFTLVEYSICMYMWLLINPKTKSSHFEVRHTMDWIYIFEVQNLQLPSNLLDGPKFLL